MLRILTLLLAVLALLVGAAFSYFNAQPVQVDWLLGQSQLPLGVLLLGAMLGGFVLAMLLIFAEQNGIDLTAALERKWFRYLS